MTLLHADPDQAWARFGDFIMNEAAEYSAWKHAKVPRPNEGAAASVPELRRQGTVEILTPEQLVAEILGGRREVVMNPLVGGLPIDEGWASLQLLAEKVLPEVTPPTAGIETPR